MWVDPSENDAAAPSDNEQQAQVAYEHTASIRGNLVGPAAQQIGAM